MTGKTMKSVKIGAVSGNAGWRIIFRWKNAAAHQVQITDYH